MAIKLTIYNRSVQLETDDQRLIDLIGVFDKTLYTTITKGFGFEPVDEITSYIGRVTGYHCYFFLSEQFKHLNHFCKNAGYTINQGDCIIEDKRKYEVETIKYKVNPKYKLWDNQIPVGEFAMETDCGTRMIPISTGSGKTVVALCILGQQAKRFGIMISPTYLGKWLEDIEEIHQGKKEEVMIVRGKTSIQTLVKVAKTGKIPWKYYIFSLPTLRSFLSVYKDNPDMCDEIYGCTPQEFFPLIKMNTLLIDEVHEAFYSVTQVLMFTNVKHVLALSATLIPDNQVLRRVQEAAFPLTCRYHDKMVSKHISFYSIEYRIHPEVMKRIRYSNGRGRDSKYDQFKFESSLMKDKKILRSYYAIIEDMIEKLYLKDYVEGDKCLILVFSVAMARDLTKHLTKLFPDKVVKPYVEKDSYKDMLTGDFIVSNPSKAGTAITIPNLRTLLQTVSTAKESTNIQNSGRLRDLKNRDVKFGWFFCPQIPNQLNHTFLRYKIFEERAKEIHRIKSHILLSRD